MLQASVQLLVIIQVLRGSGCQESKQFDEEITLPANITAESLDIIDCFTQAVNITWQNSEQLALNLSYFRNFTDDRCDMNSWHIFQCNYPLMNHLKKAKGLRNEAYHEQAEFYNTELFRSNTIEHYEKAEELQWQASQTMSDLIYQIAQIKEEAAARNEFRIFTDDCSKALLDMDSLINQSLQYNAEYNEIQTNLEIFRIRTYILRSFFLPFVVIFTLGMLGNGLLLLIFVRHRKCRMGPNVLLVNLAVSDTLFLLVNIAANYCLKLWGFPFGEEGCYVYNFVLGLSIAGCVYSLTILSFSRYIAVTAKPGSSSNRLLKSMPVILTTVWILSAVAAVPNTVTSKLSRIPSHKADCNGEYAPPVVICDFFLLSFLPLIAITCFYIAASRRLRKSVRMMPGQALGQEKVKMARERGAKILPGLIFVFAITFLPFYAYFAIVVVFEESRISYTFYSVVYFLVYINCLLNPVCLYLTSGMFRKYINNYITLGMTKKQ